MTEIGGVTHVALPVVYRGVDDNVEYLPSGGSDMGGLRQYMW